MQHIRTLAPTILDALNAVEQGCRKIQNDDQFSPDMGEWLFVGKEKCLGCLATATLMQLTNTTGRDIINRIAIDDQKHETSIFDRSLAYRIETENVHNSKKQMCQFENAINYLRQKDLSGLLEFYGLSTHKNAAIATKWIHENHPFDLSGRTSKEDLLQYADFLKAEFIPLMKNWFNN